MFSLKARVAAIAFTGVGPWCFMAVQQGYLGKNPPYIVRDPPGRPYIDVFVQEHWFGSEVAAVKACSTDPEEHLELFWHTHYCNVNWSPVFVRPVEVIYVDENGNPKRVGLVQSKLFH
jgi:hypothetical protein